MSDKNLLLSDENFLKKFNVSQFIKKHSGLSVYFTSGTTSNPKPFYSSRNEVKEIVKYLKWFCEVEGINGGERVLILMDQFFWGVGYLTAMGHIEAGNTVIPVDSDISKSILGEIVAQSKPTVISSLPSVLFEYKEILKSDSLRILETTGEPLLKKDRKELENYFNAEVFDAYGLTEGLIGVECNKHNGYHFLPDKVKLEVMDLYSGEIANENKWGELVMTNLIRTSIPRIIRYKTGDICKISSDQCNCGLNYPRVWLNGRKNKSYLLYEGYELKENDIIEIFMKVLKIIPDFNINLKNGENKDILTINLKNVDTCYFTEIYNTLANLNYEIKSMIKMNKLKIIINLINDKQ